MNRCSEFNRKAVTEMLPLYHDPHFTFRFADDRIIPRFHLEGIEAGRRIALPRVGPCRQRPSDRPQRQARLLTSHLL